MFNPGIVAGLKLDFDFSRGVTLASGKISAVANSAADQTLATQAVQGTTANQLTFVASGMNGKPVARDSGTGSTQMLVATFGAALSAPFTVICAYKHSTAVGTRCLFDGITGTAGTRASLNFADAGVFGGTAGTYCLYMFSGAGTPNGPIANATNPHVFTSVFNGSSSLTRVDGTQILSGNIGACAPTGLTMLAQYNGNNVMAGDLARLLVYSGALSVGNMQIVERGIGQTYGITVA